MATEEPDAPENSTLVNSVVCASPARRWPTMEAAKRTSWLATPDSVSRLPASRKKGMASSRNFDMPVTVEDTMAGSGKVLPKAIAT